MLAHNIRTLNARTVVSLCDKKAALIGVVDLLLRTRDVVVPIRSHTPYGLEENRLFLAICPYGHIFER